MSCRVTIGKVQFDFVNSIHIRESIKLQSDTAKLTLPRNISALVAGRNESLERKYLLDFISVDDPVVIEQGYDGDLAVEFEGYVKDISADIPVLIECEDEMYQLRKSTFNTSFSSITLSELLNYVAPEYEHEIIDDVNLGKFIISNASAFDVLESIRKKHLHSYFKAGKLVVGFPVDIKPGVKHQYNLQRNVRDAQQLHFLKAKDVKLQIKGISNNRDGTKIVETVGEPGGATRTLNFSNMTRDELRNITLKNYNSLSFDGWKGSFSAFGLPRTKAGDGIELTDPEYPDGSREGSYLVESVDNNFTPTTGWERIVKPSLSI